MDENGNPNQPWDIKPNFDPNPGPYYGIKGVKRVSNWQVALVLMAIGVIGAFFGFTSVKYVAYFKDYGFGLLMLAISRHSFDLSRQIQDEVSANAVSHHAAVVADAQKYGNEEQVRRMIDRMARSPLNQTTSK